MGKQIKSNIKEMSYRINDEIRNYDSVRIVGENVESQVMPLYDAKKFYKETRDKWLALN